MIIVFIHERGVQKVTLEAKGGPLDEPAIYMRPTSRANSSAWTMSSKKRRLAFSRS
jgi:hypothetical protein